ncbi:hypothetical protein H0A73_18910 [Alcaligenaceae bacterium]|nr:hypothetical protein [Alcaligenaceae bacterium]
MQYVIQVLSAILIGLAIGVILGPRYPVRFIGSLIAIALSLIALFTTAWVYLAAGTIVFLVVLAIPAGASSSRT